MKQLNDMQKQSGLLRALCKCKAAISFSQPECLGFTDLNELAIQRM